MKSTSSSSSAAAGDNRETPAEAEKKRLLAFQQKKSESFCDITQATLNNFGYMFVKEMPDFDLALAMMSRARPVLDVGCAFGYTCRLMLERGYRVIANDLDPKHLDALRVDLAGKSGPELITMPGDVLKLEGIEPGSLSGAFALNVLHFMSGAEIRGVFECVHRWLASDGVFMVTSLSPYASSEESRRVYYNRLRDRCEWPREPPAKENNNGMARSFHVNGCEVLIREALAVGFRLVKAAYTSILYGKHAPDAAMSDADFAYLILIKD